MCGVATPSSLEAGVLDPSLHCRRGDGHPARFSTVQVPRERVIVQRTVLFRRTTFFRCDALADPFSLSRRWSVSENKTQKFVSFFWVIQVSGIGGVGLWSLRS